MSDSAMEGSVEDEEGQWTRFGKIAAPLAPLISILGVLVAVYGAVVATSSANTAQRVAAQTADRTALAQRLHLRQESYSRFISASNEFYAEIREMRNSLPIRIENDDEVKRSTPDQLDRLRVVVAPVVKARASLSSAFLIASVVWPADIRERMSQSVKMIDPIGVCYEKAAIRQLDLEESNLVKGQITASCHGLKAAEDAWFQSFREITSFMAKSIHSDQEKLGADPEGM